ncbi:MAG TPA: hypothetical protein VEC06_07605 [Paucimonas sp.]|nr:hypothetical protein [Paucimonas sp.]
MLSIKLLVTLCAAPLVLGGCAVVTVAGAAVSVGTAVVGTGITVGSAAVGAAASVAKGTVNAVGSVLEKDEEKEAE